MYLRKVRKSILSAFHESRRYKYENKRHLEIDAKKLNGRVKDRIKKVEMLNSIINLKQMFYEEKVM